MKWNQSRNKDQSRASWCCSLGWSEKGWTNRGIHPCWIHQSYQFSEPSNWKMMHKSSTINSWETTKVLLTLICKFNSNSNEYGAGDYRFDTQVRSSLDRVDDDGYELKLKLKKH